MKHELYLFTGVLVKSKMGVARLSAGDLDFLKAEQYDEPRDDNQSISYFLVRALAK